MTWKELADRISKMSADKLTQDVRFVEPYDNNAQGYVLELGVAQEDINLNTDSGEILFAKLGETILV